MNISKAYLVGTHRYSFKAGKPKEITGLKFISNEKIKDRLCYKVKIGSVIDYVPVCDTENYKIITEEQLIKGEIPEVIN